MSSEPLRQSFLYKDGKAELFDDTEVEAKLADGWYDNPAASLEVKPKRRRKSRSPQPVDPDKSVSDENNEDDGDGGSSSSGRFDGPADPNDPDKVQAKMAAESAPRRAPGRPRKNAAPPLLNAR